MLMGSNQDLSLEQYRVSPQRDMERDSAMNNYEIIERSSGYWIVDDWGVVNGPYDSVEEAAPDVPKGQLQSPLLLEDYYEKKSVL